MNPVMKTTGLLTVGIVRRTMGAFVLSACALSTVTPVFSAPPKAPNQQNRGKDAIDSALELQAEHGPWLILAASFEGNGSKERSLRLARELKDSFQLQAYVMPKSFDYTQSMLGNGMTESGAPKKMRYKDRKVVEGYAVLVGNFDSIDSPAIKESLTYVKKLKPKVFASMQQSKDANSMSVTVDEYRAWLRNFGANKEEQDAAPGPMSNAFVTRNPMLPADYYKAPEVDRFVKKLNEEAAVAEHNLLKCPGKFTVRVATFRGEDQFVSWGRSNDGKSKQENEMTQLEKAAESAMLATKALRAAGYEAYQFHDRTHSIVTVGSFNELGAQDAQRNFAYDPNIQKIVSTFGASPKPVQSQFGPGYSPKLLLGDLVQQKDIPELVKAKGKEQIAIFAKYAQIAFDVKPTPIAVPRYETTSIYAGSLLGKDRR